MKLSVKLTSAPSDWLEAHSPPTKLHSGGYSRWLINSGELYKNPAVRDAVFSHWFLYLEAKGIRNLSLKPIPWGGIPWAEGFRMYLNDRNYGWNGSFPIIVDDVSTTGSSIIEARREVGPNTPALVVVDRSGKQGKWGGTEPVCSWMKIELPIVGETGKK